MKIILHHAHEARSMRILWLLEEIGAPYDLRLYDFFDKSLRSPEYLAISPAGRVPALEIDGATMVESGAMVEYLCELFPDAGLSVPAGAPGRMAWLDWLHYAETIGQHCANLTQAHIVLYEPWMQSPTQMSLEAKRLAKVLGRIETQMGDHRPYLLGDFSAVDCAVGYGVHLAAKFIRFDGLPKVAAYYDRISARPGFQKALPPAGARLIYSKDFYEAPDV